MEEITEEEKLFEIQIQKDIRLRDIRDHLEEMYLPYKMLSVGEILKMIQFAHYPVEEVCPSCNNYGYLKISGYCVTCDKKEYD